MHIEIQELNSYTRDMAVTVPWADLEGSYERALSEFRRRVQLPGFRGGKVPRKIVLKKFGSEIEADFAREAAEEFYRKALDQKELSPVNRASISNLRFELGSQLQFTAVFEVEPEIKLPTYRKKFRVRKNVYLLDDQDVDLYIQDLRQQYAELRTVESGSQEGHLLFVDMQELDRTGVPIVGRKVEGRYLKVGEGVFGGENLNRLTNLRVGDRAIVELATGSGETVKYELRIRNVQEQILPELDEDFIAKVDDSAKSESQLRENVRRRIQAKLDRDAESQLNEAIIDYLLRNTPQEVPPSMVEKYIENMLAEARKNDGESLDEEKFRREVKPSAVRNLRWYLIRKALIKAEKLEVSDQEVEAEVDKIAERAGDDNRKIRRFYRKPSNRERVRDDLLDRKLFDLLKSLAKTEEVKIYTKDLRKQQTASPA